MGLQLPNRRSYGARQTTFGNHQKEIRALQRATELRFPDLFGQVGDDMGQAQQQKARPGTRFYGDRDNGLRNDDSWAEGDLVRLMGRGHARIPTPCSSCSIRLLLCLFLPFSRVLGDCSRKRGGAHGRLETRTTRLAFWKRRRCHGARYQDDLLVYAMFTWYASLIDLRIIFYSSTFASCLLVSNSMTTLFSFSQCLSHRLSPMLSSRHFDRLSAVRPGGLNKDVFHPNALRRPAVSGGGQIRKSAGQHGRRTRTFPLIQSSRRCDRQ